MFIWNYRECVGSLSADVGEGFSHVGSLSVTVGAGFWHVGSLLADVGAGFSHVGTLLADAIICTRERLVYTPERRFSSSSLRG